MTRGIVPTYNDVKGKDMTVWSNTDKDYIKEYVEISVNEYLKDYLIPNETCWNCNTVITEDEDQCCIVEKKLNHKIHSKFIGGRVSFVVRFKKVLIKRIY